MTEETDPDEESEESEKYKKELEKALKDDEHCRKAGIYPYPPIIKPW